MATAAVEIRGMVELRRKLDELEQAVGQMDDPASDALELLKKRLQEYPPPPVWQYLPAHREPEE